MISWSAYQSQGICSCSPDDSADLTPDQSLRCWDAQAYNFFPGAQSDIKIAQKKFNLSSLGHPLKVQNLEDGCLGCSTHPPTRSRMALDSFCVSEQCCLPEPLLSFCFLLRWSSLSVNISVWAQNSSNRANVVWSPANTREPAPLSKARLLFNTGDWFFFSPEGDITRCWLTIYNQQEALNLPDVCVGKSSRAHSVPV